MVQFPIIGSISAVQEGVKDPPPYEKQNIDSGPHLDGAGYTDKCSRYNPRLGKGNYRDSKTSTHLAQFHYHISQFHIGFSQADYVCGETNSGSMVNKYHPGFSVQLRPGSRS